MNVSAPGQGLLAHELAAFERLLPGLRANEGKYAVIAGDEAIGCFTTYEEALSAGYQARGLDPFLVKKISAAGPAMHMTRDIAGHASLRLSSHR